MIFFFKIIIQYLNLNYKLIILNERISIKNDVAIRPNIIWVIFKPKIYIIPCQLFWAKRPDQPVV